MKMVIVLVALGMVLLTTPAFGAGSCKHDPIVKGWIAERDKNALQLVRVWISGEPEEIIAPLVGLVWANETNIAALCRKETGFLERHRLLFGELNFPLTVDTVPPLVFQRLIQDEVLSPERQYKQKNKGVRRGYKR